MTIKIDCRLHRSIIPTLVYTVLDLTISQLQEKHIFLPPHFISHQIFCPVLVNFVEYHRMLVLSTTTSTLVDFVEYHRMLILSTSTSTLVNFVEYHRMLILSTSTSTLVNFVEYHRMLILSTSTSTLVNFVEYHRMLIYLLVD